MQTPLVTLLLPPLLLLLPLLPPHSSVSSPWCPGYRISSSGGAELAKTASVSSRLANGTVSATLRGTS